MGHVMGLTFVCVSGIEENGKNSVIYMKLMDH